MAEKEAPSSNQWALYERLGAIEARPATEADRADERISISPADIGRPTLDGGMIARNPSNHDDQWYIAPEYFARHYRRPVETTGQWGGVEKLAEQRNTAYRALERIEERLRGYAEFSPADELHRIVLEALWNKPVPETAGLQIDRKRLRNVIGSTYVEDSGPHVVDDNLAIALCTYFDKHIECPNEENDETGWKPWVTQKCNAALDAVTDAVIKLLGNKPRPEETTATGSADCLDCQMATRSGQAGCSQHVKAKGDQ